MTVSRREGPFVAEITGGLLSTRRYQSCEGWGKGGELFTGCAVDPIFICPIAKMPWFVMHGDGVYAQNAHDALTPLYRGEDAAQLLSCITVVLTEHAVTAEKERQLRRKILKWAPPCGVLLLSVMLLIPPSPGPSFSDFTGPSGETGQRQMPSPRPAFHPPGVPATHPAPVPAAPAPQVTPGVMDNTAGTAPAEGWSLPLSARAALPAKLQKAASRGLFTVPLSSGHARTLYVFADPDCPNCQRMERHFETAAGQVNVVIFPVTIEGGEASLKALTPVMALDEPARAAAWKRLFAADAGIGIPGAPHAAPAVTDETLAETARGAIGVNEVAFRAYRLPGTPWTISDDGRYVPQAVLSSPAALTAFLNRGDYVGQ
jgi:TrbB protein